MNWFSHFVGSIHHKLKIAGNKKKSCTELNEERAIKGRREEKPAVIE